MCQQHASRYCRTRPANGGHAFDNFSTCSLTEKLALDLNGLAQRPLLNGDLDHNEDGETNTVQRD